MFPNLFQLIVGRPHASAPAHNPFVEEVHVRESEPRDPRVERLVLWCWILIAVKHVLVIWAVYRYSVPVHQLWVNFPTWLLGVLATGLYFWRVRQR